MATDKERLEQLSKVNEGSNVEEENDLQVFLPTAHIFTLGKKKFEVKELPLRKMALLLELNQIPMDTSDNLDKVILILCKLLGEENQALIDEHMTLTKALEYGKMLTTVTYASIPQATEDQKKSISSETD